MKKILDLLKKLFGKKELAGKAVEVKKEEPVVVVKPVAPKKKPAKKKKKNEPK
jgi:hypothetical protein